MSRRILSLSVVATAAILSFASAQSPAPAIKAPTIQTVINRPSLVLPSNLSQRTKLAALANLATRYSQIRPFRPVQFKSGYGINGLQYMIGKTAPTLPANSNAATATTRQPKNLVVCKTTPVSIAKRFAGPLFTGSGTSANQSVIYPGALFRDSDVVRGAFTPQMLPRLPGNITIDVFNQGGGVVAPVANFNDRTAVVVAINNLRNETVSAETLTSLDYTEFTVAASQELSFNIESSMDVDIGPSIELPVPTPFNVPGASAGVAVDASITESNSQNFAIGMIDQTFYTISVGGEGPASTVIDSIPADIVAVTDVQYGRVAYIIVSSFASSVSARSVVQELLSAASPVSSVTQQSQLSSSAQFALQSNFVRVKIVGGQTANAVLVKDLQTLRNYVEQIKATVGGSNAVPLRYTLRYAADNSTAFVAAIASFNDRECARASQLRVKLKNITPTTVVDFGDEELYGKIEVKTGAGITAQSTDELWNVSSGSAVQGKQNVAISIGKEIFINLNPLDGPSPANVKLDFNVKDRIMGEEWPGASQAGKDNGFVSYNPDEGNVSLQEIRDAPNSTKAKSYTLTESGQTAAVRLNFDFELIPVR